jgi:hypothetical protein
MVDSGVVGVCRPRQPRTYVALSVTFVRPGSCYGKGMGESLL